MSSADSMQTCITPQSATSTFITNHDSQNVIPLTQSIRSRTLVVCFDGTGGQFDNDNSNIIQLVALLKKDDRHQQLVYYQSGIGTYISTHSHAITEGIKKTLDIMFAWSMKHHVIGGYEFLMQHYVAGDKICLFGFSRGAYIARSLAGMLHKIGLLPASNFQQVPFAYKMYERVDDVGWEQSNEFKKAFCVDVPIEFIGVWDTVDSVGIIQKRLPFTTSNTIVRTFRHAVSLDERRARFNANLWNRTTEKDQQRGTTTTAPTVTPIMPERASDNPADRDAEDIKKKTFPRKTEDSMKLETQHSQRGSEPTNILEVWFAGCHRDVGGGSVSNKTRHSLARISLRWMVRECIKANTGILFCYDKLCEIGLDPNTLYHSDTDRPPLLPSGDHRIKDRPKTPIPIQVHKYLKRKNLPAVIDKLKEATEVFKSEEEEEMRDALSPKYDPLKMRKGWWLLEILPTQTRYRGSKGEWGINMGGPRCIHENKVHVHRSVKLRMAARYENGKAYKPKVDLSRHEVTYVD